MTSFRVQDVFALYRHIFCACSCGHVFRLADARIAERSVKAPRDWLANLTLRINRLERQHERAEERFEARRETIRDHARKRARRLCDLAVGRVILNFKKLAINSSEVKTIFSPIRFVVFDGLAERQPRRVRFLDGPATDRTHERIHRSLEDTIAHGNVAWSTIRVADDGNVTREIE